MAAARPSSRASRRPDSGESGLGRGRAPLADDARGHGDERTQLPFDPMPDKADPAEGPGPPPPHFHGHRQRLRARFLLGGTAALQDYELLELLLAGVKPRGDVKPLAKDLLTRFGRFADVISASPEALSAVPGMGDASVVALKAVRAAAERLAREEVIDRPVLGSWGRLLDYCRIALARETVEQLRLLFLDRRNALIADEVQQRGTVDHTPVYPREVIKRALELNATALILVHNHPSGDPTPSRADIDMTRAIVEAGRPLGVALHDHLVIGRASHVSFRAKGLL